MLYHHVIPVRSFDAVKHHWQDSQVRSRLVAAGAEFISDSDVMCNADGCLTRIGDQVGALTTSDVIHLTEKGSIFLIDAIIDRVLNGQTAPTTAAIQ